MSKIFEGLPFLPEVFGMKKFNPQDYPYNGPLPFEYAYCVTAHKAQGDEWDNVVVFEEQWPQAWEARRWSYTAASRARKCLVWGSADPRSEPDRH